MGFKKAVFVKVSVFSMLLTQAIAAQALDMTTCLHKQLLLSDDSTTIGEMKALCEVKIAQFSELETVTKADEPDAIESAITRRKKMEMQSEFSLFSLMPHKPNYLIFSNNLATANEKPFKEAFPDNNISLQPLETKFQISLKTALARGVFKGHGDLYAGYTGRFFWQQFNKAGSSPFRETDHEPELWLSFSNDTEVLGFRNSVVRAGIVHQSNGQSGSLSRSWNRVYADFIIEKGNWYFSVKPWWRLPEKSDEDDNPNIDDYLGNFELSGLYKYGEHTFNFMARDNLDFSDNHGALELGWSFPIFKKVKGYVQWFNGYGESMIDYDAYSNSIGVGVKLSDWL